MQMLQVLNIPLDFSPFLLLFSLVSTATPAVCTTKNNVLKYECMCMFVYPCNYQRG